MDREKAIQMLKRCEAESYCNHYKQQHCCIGCGQREALDLAIEALEREIEYGQMVVDLTNGETMKSDEWKYDTTCVAESATTTDCNYTCSDCKHQDKTYEQEPCHSCFNNDGAGYEPDTDCISRADTIKALCQECEMKCVCDHDCTEVAVVKGMPSMSEEEVDYCNNCPYISFNEDCCISRQDAIEAVRLATAGKRPLERGDILDILYSTPLVTPPKRVVAQISIDTEELIERIKEEYEITDKVGEWVRQYCFQHWKCSECEYEIDGKTNYCPNCGAKMKGGTE